VAYSPDGNQIAVGLGGRTGHGGAGKKDGAFLILNEPDLNIMYEGRDSQQWIRECKYSPDGKTLAMGACDNNVYLYNVEDNWTKRAVFSKHNSYITHLDFTKDSNHMQSNCGAYELLFADVTTGSQIPTASALKNSEWSTWSCVLGWPVQGVWPQETDGTEINSVDRSHDGSVLATSDNFGRVKLYRYPAVSEGAADTCYRGHSSHVTNVRWLVGDTHLISTGGSDRCVFQWKHEADLEVESADEGHEEDSDVEAFGDSMVYSMEPDAGTDRFMAVKPWLGAVVAPTNHPEQDVTPPALDLALDYVHGYRAQDARSNLYYNASGEVVYSSAGVGIIYNTVEHAQKFYIGHDDDIISLAMSPCRQYVATGQLGKRPVVRVWDASTGQEICVLPHFHKRGIPCVTFSPDGKRIASVGQDTHHSVAIYVTKSGEWHDGVKQATEKGDTNKTLFVHFTGREDYTLVTGGVKHVKFWQVHGRSLNVKRGIFGKKAKLQAVLCAATLTGNVTPVVITGTVSGHIYAFQGRRVEKVVLAHTASVNCLYSTSKGVASGGKDGYVKLWDPSLNKIAEFCMHEATPKPYRPPVRAVVWDVPTNKILVGTKGSEIYEIAKDSKRTVLLNEGHCAHELWGLSMHPKDPDLFATCGDDKTVRVWSISKRKLVKKAVLDSMARALAWSPDGNSLAVGLGGRVSKGGASGSLKKDGAYVVLETETMGIVHEDRKSKQWISDIKYSPDGFTLAIGSRDNSIYLHDVNSSYSVRAMCTKHNSFITHFDFSTDSASLQSNCGGYELLFYNTIDGTQNPSASSVKNVEWSTWTCTLGWPVQGIWTEDTEGSDVNAAHRSNSKELVATADELGHVRVFNYPSIEKGGAWVEGVGHSSHVTNIRFNLSDENIVTCGGNDRSVFVWKVKRHT